ncbi:putative carbohydrate esterase family 4 protein [Lyophyllum shimeji]|uniref:Carbohydrate esterase family 4 protein n=1 Tax=Lyophyllum shimeji TaxID=47721 RepID=A0A9P3PSL0_LYOSH|nr:putative carbohydrate esterase family 4 protein [Lyophyllum shimeji]
MTIMKFTNKVLCAALVTLALALFACAAESDSQDTTADLDGLARAQVVTKCTVPGTAALTFDDGPSVYLQELSDTLVAAGVKATFFVNGQNYDCIYNSGPAQRLKHAYDAGHQVASHTWSHAHLTQLGKDQLDAEFGRTEEAIHRITGAAPAFTRPPYGEYNALVLDVAAAHRQTLVTWDFDSGDTTGKTAAESNEAYDELAARHPSTILALNHDVKEQTVRVVVPHAIFTLQKAGYKLVTLAECLGREAYLDAGAAGARDAQWRC